jgi:predicted ATP-binding protein involved in virulence
MKIVRLEGHRVHGYLSYSLAFNSELTFVTGINGSGKTTAVRSMIWLLSPSLSALAELEYEKLSATVVHNEQRVIVSTIKTPHGFEILCSGVKEALKIPHLDTYQHETRAAFREYEQDFYRDFEAQHKSHGVLETLAKLPTPMFLDLERQHKPFSRRRRAEPRSSVREHFGNPLGGAIGDSLTDAQLLAEERYRRFLANRSDLTDTLKQNIILSAFDTTDDTGDVGQALGDTEATTRRLTKNKDVLSESLREIGIGEERITGQVHPFFERAQAVLQSAPTTDDLERLTKTKDSKRVNNTLERLSALLELQPRLRRIDKLRNLIDDYSREVDRLHEPIARFTSAVNQFLSDSGKSLLFTPTGGLRTFIERAKVDRPIRAMSSGERQLIVILTHLAFNPEAHRAGVLVIDEPELSLHLRWQELFVDAVRATSPSLQIILATHSPSIVLDRTDACVDIREAPPA